MEYVQLDHHGFDLYLYLYLCLVRDPGPCLYVVPDQEVDHFHGQSFFFHHQS